MTVTGFASLQGGRTYKAVVNESGAIFFSADLQHSTMKAHGVSYEDDYRGNAVAAIFQSGRCEIRFHQDFSPARVAALWTSLTRQPGLEALGGYCVTYQGKAVPTTT
jgi:hypothetical protein